jgi:inosose dehydratase
VIRVANAPCSWGVLEFEAPAIHAPAAQVLDEMAAAGYAGTELGDWGFLSTEPAALAADVQRRALSLVGAFVPIALAREDALDEGVERAVRTARLLAGVHAEKGSYPFSALIVLSDDNTRVPNRTARAGRIREQDGLSPAEWDAFADRAGRVASAVRDATGIRTVFHHHCAGYVETPREIDALMSRTSPDLLGLCLDTGHLMYGGGNPVDAIAKYRGRIWHVHFKDCEPELARQARAEGWDYHTAVGRGIFCELGKGMVPFVNVLDALRVEYYAGWIVVEQDVLPGLGTPAASASRNRQYLRRLGV